MSAACSLFPFLQYHRHPPSAHLSPFFTDCLCSRPSASHTLPSPTDISAPLLADHHVALFLSSRATHFVTSSAANASSKTKKLVRVHLLKTFWWRCRCRGCQPALPCRSALRERRYYHVTRILSAEVLGATSRRLRHRQASLFILVLLPCKPLTTGTPPCTGRMDTSIALSSTA